MHPRPGPHPGPRKPCLAGTIDLAGPFQEPPDRFEDPDIELVAEDFRLWTPAAAAYDLILCLEVLERIPEFETIFELGEVALRPKGQLIFTHEPLIEAHPEYGRAP